ncbi:MAG TPA: winged helix-turn-helix domain-containing protein [Blastocatellia bacterium]|nr:winged helix-turn-helix domain-containing protein [Blastocatellia bacterium]
MEMAGPQPSRLARFGVFEVNVQSGELRRRGQKVKLQDKPFQALSLLLERSGEVVTRDELRNRLWAADTFVEFDDNLNSAIKRVREALGDSGGTPRYIETLPKRGYRFIPPVEWVDDTLAEQEESITSANAALAAVNGPLAPPESAAHLQAGILNRRPLWLSFVAAVLLIGGVAGIWQWRRSRAGQGTSTLASHQLMLAVLPFKNLSGDPGQDFVSDGMTEEMTAQLGRLYPQGLGVIARSSVTRYKDTAKDVAEIGHELGVGYILEGSVRRDSNDAFITAQLIRVSDQTHLWAETYERPLSDVFSVQRDVARRVTESLALRLLPDQILALARADTNSTSAYEAYLRGRFAFEQGTQSSFQNAIEYFSIAIRDDPNYAVAFSALARTYLSQGEFHFASSDEVQRNASDSVANGLRLDSSLPDLYVLQAKVRSLQQAPAQSVEEAYKRAIEVGPNDAEAHQEYALFLRSSDRLDEATAEIGKAIQLNPNSPWTETCGGWVLLDSGKFDQAASRLDRAVGLDPNYPAAMYFYGRLEEARKNVDKEIGWFERATKASGRAPKYLHALAIAYANAGRSDEAGKLLDEIRADSKSGYVSPEYIKSIEDAINRSHQLK